MTPLVREMATLVPEPETAHWFDLGTIPGRIELYNSDPLPFVAPCSATDCLPEIERFAAIVAAAEREACARLCEDGDNELENGRYCAVVIRERGEE